MFSTRKNNNGLLGEFLQDSSDIAVTEDLPSFGRKTQVSDDYTPPDEVEKNSDDIASKKRVRIRVPVVRNRNAREHALTVVRRRPLVPYSRSSSIYAVETTPSPTPRKIVTRTRLRNIDSINGDNHLRDDISNDLFTKVNRHKVTVTRRRKIRPTATISSTHRERITRKKLVTVRPIPEPTSTLAIITTGFYTIPSSDENEEYFESDTSKMPTPELYTSHLFESSIATIITPTVKSNSNLNKPTSSSDPIIITDNFFFPETFEETTTIESENNYDEEAYTESNASIDLTTVNNIESENITNKVIDVEATTENEIDTTTNNIVDLMDAIVSTVDDNEATTPIENVEAMKKLMLESVIDIKQVNNSNAPKLNTNTGILEDTAAQKTLEITTDNIEYNLSVIPIMTDLDREKNIFSSTLVNQEASTYVENTSEYNHDLDNSDIPTVIPLEEKSVFKEDVSVIKTKMTSASEMQITASLSPITPEDIEAGLTDDLYLSLSRPDFPQIVPSKVEFDDDNLLTSHSSQAIPEIQTSIYFSETTVTSTRLRTYTYVVTKLNGQETEVTSSTTVRPRVTTLTLTVPVTVTVTPTMVSPSIALSSTLENVRSSTESEDEGRKFNLETRVMSNGVEVIVAGTSPAYRWENSNPQPTLTLSEAVVMLLPQEKPNEFVTKTCTTTFTYLNTITRNGTTIVSTDQQVIANTATEERHRKPASEAASVTLEASPTLQTEVFKTTYTYLTLNTDHPDEKDALESSTRVIANTVTAPQYYLDMILEPSEAQRPETNTYLSTRILEKTFVEDGQTKIEKINDIVTQLIITESVPPSQSVSVAPTPTTVDEAINPTTDIAKTYYVTYTYYNTYLEKDSTVVETNIATSSDIVYEKAPIKKTSTKSIAMNATPEPIQIFATKTYLTTYTYFTTLLQTETDGKVSTTTSSRKKIVENVVTESIAPSLLDAGYMNALLTTSHHSDNLKNVITGSTIIFFDDDESVIPTTTNTLDASASVTIDKIDSIENTSTPSTIDSVGSETNAATSRPIEQDVSEDETVEESTDPPLNKKPSQVSNLLSLGSLGINSLSALGPVITAMAGLLQGKTSASRRNDTESPTESSITTTQRSPIYIPVAEFVDGDIETAESQNIALLLANNNHLPETRHKVTSSLADGIPISPGEVITANSDVIIGKPGKMGPRPPQTFLNDENIGMKPPPVPVPNIPVHPVLEVDESASVNKAIKIQKGSQQIEIFPAHQIYEEHIKIHEPVVSKRPQNLQQAFLNSPPKRISSKQDILENDPLLIPPSILPNINTDLEHYNSDKSKRPWSPKDPLPASGILIEEKNRLNYLQKDFVQPKLVGTADGSRIKSYVPEPIVHQVPHVIERSTGQPLLVNIQPSQVANVVIPQGGTQALIFGDTSEPHISGQYFDDPSPYPEPEVGPGFIGIDKVENLPQFSKNHNPADYMTPPSPPSTVTTSQSSVAGNRPHVIPLSQDLDFKQNINTILRPEKIPIRQNDNSNLSSGQGHVHTEILVHHGAEDGYIRPQSRPTIPMRNYQKLQYPPRREHVKTNSQIENIPPRRNEVPVPTQNAFVDLANAPISGITWKNEKKPLRNSQTRWPRPTTRPRPSRITGRPYGIPTRMERPINPARQPQFPHTRIPQNNYQQKEFNKYNQQLSTATSFADSNQQFYMPGVKNQNHPDHKVFNYQGKHDNGNTKVQTNYSVHENKDYINRNNFSNTIFGYRTPTVVNESHSSGTKYPEKTIDSEVDASETVKVTSDVQESDDDDLLTNSENEYDDSIKFDHKKYVINNDSTHDNNFDSVRRKQLHNINDQGKVDLNEGGEIIIGSEKSIIEMQTPNNKQNFYIANTNLNNDKSERNPNREIIDLKPPAIIPVFEPNGHSRPFSKLHFITSKSENKPDITTEILEQNHNAFQGHIRPGIGQVLHVKADKNELETQLEVHSDESYSHLGQSRPEYSTRIHPDHPQIITKPKPQVPGPVIVSSGKTREQNSNYRRPSMKFSLPIDSTGQENESKTQTERPPSINTALDNKYKGESLDTAFQTNFANTDSEEKKVSSNGSGINTSHIEFQKPTTSKNHLFSHDIVPPPIDSTNNHKKLINNESLDEGLKPPPSPTDVLGLSPPPVDITTTIRSPENKSNYHKTSMNVSGLKPPPLYIPLKESSVTPPLPSMSMVPPNPRPSIVRPYLADILSQDMVPPPPDMKTTHPLEITTVRPGVAVSGSIQIATAVATSHIPVIQDIESKIPIVHGTVDLPVIVDVPEFLKPIDTKKTDHVSIYTVRPFETRQRSSVKSTISPTSSSSSTAFRQSQASNEKHNSPDDHIYSSTKLSSPHIIKKPSTILESSILLEPSTDIHLPFAKIEPTESLSINNINKKTREKSSVEPEVRTKAPHIENSQVFKSFDKSSVENLDAKITNQKIKESASKMMEIIGTVVHEFIQNSTNERIEIKPQEVTRFETLTVTRTETSVIGSPPTTMTLLITRTLTSTRVETVTETLLRPTSVISTITSTVLQSVTHVPAYESGNDNESIFVVMSDQKPPAPGAEEVEAEYGEEDVSRDEQDISGNEIHRVLSGGILGSPSVPIKPPKIQCVPECKASKSEICAEANGEMRCVCRPGFARMFPDRPCKPTYTFTVGVGLDRIGRDRFMYDSEMNDTNSIVFRRYALPIKEALDRTLMQSDLRDVYRGLSIAKFAPDPTRVLFNVQLSSNTDETRLKEVIRKYLVMSNYSLGGTEVYASKDLGLIEVNDFDECTREDGGHHHDCSPNAACFNIKGSYQCSCKEGWADLSENPAYPGRICSQAPLGCAACNNRGHCIVNSYGQEVCECFPWHSGQKCQVNLKVLLIVLTSGAILLGILAFVVGIMCFRNQNRRRISADRRAMISGAGGDTSSEGSVAELAIPHHVPHILPPPPQMVAPAPPVKKSIRKISGKPRRAPRKPAPVIAPVLTNNGAPCNDQRDRSLTVMIPRAKYRSAPQSATPQNYKTMSTFAVDEHKLIDYLDSGSHPGNRKCSLISNPDYKESEHRTSKQHANFTPSGALVSAGFQVSATVTRTLDAESTLARSCGETTVEPSTKVIRNTDYAQELESTLVRSCAETTIEASTKQLLRLDLAEAGSTLARSCGETTIQPPTKVAERKDCNRDARDSASEGHTMAERDLGSTLRLPAQHAPLYNQDRTSSDRESNFDSL